MKYYFDVKQYQLKCKKNILIDNFSLDLEKEKYVCILGASGSGKSLLFTKKFYKSNGVISFYLGEEKKVLNWREEFHYNELEENFKIFLDEFLKDEKNSSYKYAVVSSLLQHPNYFLCEDLHTILHYREMELFISFLRKQKIKILYITNHIEDTLFFDYLIVLSNNKIALEGNTLSVLKEEKLMKLLGFSLPFYVNLSIQLKYYGIVHDIILNKEDLKRALWQ